MRYFVTVCLFSLLLTSVIFSQTRDEAIIEIQNLQEKIAELEKILIEPDSTDLETASEEDLDVFRLLPREKYDSVNSRVRGGGAFYSFTKKSHSYNDTPQIKLEQKSLGVGFAGADYGFIADLGKTAIETVSQTREGLFFLNYQPAKLEKDARAEHRKFWNFEENGMVLSSRKTAIIGNTYLLRAISFGEADTLVVFKIHRQDTDGSLIIFWKKLKEFDKPELIRDNFASADK